MLGSRFLAVDLSAVTDIDFVVPGEQINYPPQRRTLNLLLLKLWQFRNFTAILVKMFSKHEIIKRNCINCNASVLCLVSCSCDASSFYNDKDKIINQTCGKRITASIHNKSNT